MEKDKDLYIQELLNEKEANGKTIKALMKRVEATLSVDTNAFSEFGNSVILAKKIEKRTQQLKEATGELEEASKYNLAIIHSLADNLIVVDSNGIIKDLNEKTIETSKSPRRKLIGKGIGSLVEIGRTPQSKGKSIESLLKEVKDKGSIKSEEVSFIDSKNKKISCLLTGSVLKGSVDEVKSIVFLLRDITELKKMERVVENERMKSMSSAKLASLGEMAGGVAHEINNPLAIISGTLLLMKRELEKDQLEEEKLLTSIERIDGTVKRIVRIVQGLRNITRADGVFEIEPVVQREVFEDVLGLCGEKFKSNGVELICEFEDENAMIPCERVQFSQVLLNILGNAYDAVFSDSEDSKWIKIETQFLNNNFVVRIQNSGMKIPPSIEEKMFNPFFTSKEVGKGTGLGLSLSKSIIEKHKGHLHLDSSCDHTCFEILIPNSEKTGETNEQVG